MQIHTIRHIGRYSTLLCSIGFTSQHSQFVTPQYRCSGVQCIAVRWSTVEYGTETALPRVQCVAISVYFSALQLHDDMVLCGTFHSIRIEIFFIAVQHSTWHLHWSSPLKCYYSTLHCLGISCSAFHNIHKMPSVAKDITDITILQYISPSHDITVKYPALQVHCINVLYKRPYVTLRRRTLQCKKKKVHYIALQYNTVRYKAW